MKIIGVVGPRQSGSTLLFNLIRTALIESGYKVSSCWVEFYENNDKNIDYNADYLVVKAHAFNNNLCENASLIFMPIRDPRDAYLSHMIRFNSEKINEYMHNNICYYNDWIKFSNYVCKYEKYVENPQKIICEVVKKLGLLNVDTGALQKSVEKLWDHPEVVEYDDVNSEFYLKTLLTKNHNTSGGKVGKYLQKFTQDQHGEIKNDELIRKFMEEMDYKLI